MTTNSTFTYNIAKFTKAHLKTTSEESTKHCVIQNYAADFTDLQSGIGNDERIHYLRAKCVVTKQISKIWQRDQL